MPGDALARVGSHPQPHSLPGVEPSRSPGLRSDTAAQGWDPCLGKAAPRITPPGLGQPWPAVCSPSRHQSMSLSGMGAGSRQVPGQPLCARGRARPPNKARRHRAAARHCSSSTCKEALAEVFAKRLVSCVGCLPSPQDGAVPGAALPFAPWPQYLGLFTLCPSAGSTRAYLALSHTTADAELRLPTPALWPLPPQTTAEPALTR